MGAIYRPFPGRYGIGKFPLTVWPDRGGWFHERQKGFDEAWSLKQKSDSPMKRSVTA